MKGRRVELDEESRQYFVSFDAHLKLKKVIAGARFPLGKRPIEKALEGYPETVEIARARASPNRFAIIVEKRGFDAKGLV